MRFMTPFRERQLKFREEAILDATHGLLGTVGYDAMTMDDVASAVGIAKGSLYKHFESKEELATNAMIRLLTRSEQALADMPADMMAIEKLRALLTWALQERLRGGVPYLPSNSRALEEFLLTHERYLAAVFALNASLMQLIEKAKDAKHLRDDVPTDFIMMTIYARTCDPTLERLKRSGTYSDAEIVTHMVAACFGGIATRS
jgi:TetR/AcrR family transcriptional regulator, cholesterol catabolism regulator